MKPGLNPGGPPPKAKYSSATDSESVARANDEKNPDKGSSKNLKPCAYKRSEHLMCVMACLLHNDPASYRHQQVKALRAAARGKPSLNRAHVVGGRRETW